MLWSVVLVRDMCNGPAAVINTTTSEHAASLLLVFDFLHFALSVQCVWLFFNTVSYAISSAVELGCANNTTKFYSNQCF